MNEVLLEVQAELAAAKLLDITIGNLFESSQRYVPVENARYGSIRFSAVYDRDQKLISDIEVAGEILSQNAIRLEKIPALFEPKREQVLQNEGTNIVRRENKSEKVAKIILQDRLGSLEFKFDIGQIQTVNFANKEFYVYGALLPHGKQQIFVSFRFQMNDNKAANIVVKTLQGPLQMTDSVDFADLALKIREFYDKAFYEQVDGELEEKSGEKSGSVN